MALEQENSQLKRPIADLSLDYAMLRRLSRKTLDPHQGGLTKHGKKTGGGAHLQQTFVVLEPRALVPRQGYAERSSNPAQANAMLRSSPKLKNV